MMARETTICQCAGLSHSSAGYYDSIVGRLSEMVQTALSTALSHWGRDDNALLKYDTFPGTTAPLGYIQPSIYYSTVSLPPPMIQDLND